MYGSHDAEIQFTSKIRRVTLLTALKSKRVASASAHRGMAEMEEAGLDVPGVGRNVAARRG